MPTGVEEAAVTAGLAAGLAKLLDTAANAAQGVDVLVGWAKAQEGVKYNSHVFGLPGVEAATDKDEAKPSASLASPRARKRDNNDEPTISMSAPIVFEPQGRWRPLLVVRAKARDLSAGKLPGGMPVGAGFLQFALALRQSSAGTFDNGQVVLTKSDGFDTSVGSQAEFEFSGQPWSSSRYLLTFAGQINPWGNGFARIAGGVIVDRWGELQPHGSWLTGDKWRYGQTEFRNYVPWDKGRGFVVEV